MSRIVLKISGEALKGDNANVCNEKLDSILNIVKLLNMKHKVAIVIGGGNYFRGRENTNMEVVTRDTIGMLGTCMNALFIKDYLEKNDLKVTISTPFSFPNLIEDLSDEELRQRYDNGDIIVFGGGVGKSGYSTDSGVILATKKLNSDLIIKLTNVEGVYDSDPKVNKNAKKFDKLTFKEVLDNDYQIMDRYAIDKCLEYNIKILVMNFNKWELLKDYFNGMLVGTEIGE